MPAARCSDVRLFPCASGLAQVDLLAEAVHTAGGLRGRTGPGPARRGPAGTGPGASCPGRHRGRHARLADHPDRGRRRSGHGHRRRVPGPGAGRPPVRLLNYRVTRSPRPGRTSAGHGPCPRGHGRSWPGRRPLAASTSRSPAGPRQDGAPGRPKPRPCRKWPCRCDGPANRRIDGGRRDRDQAREPLIVGGLVAGSARRGPSAGCQRCRRRMGWMSHLSGHGWRRTRWQGPPRVVIIRVSGHGGTSRRPGASRPVRIIRRTRS